jgi:hypothetical protein
MAPGGGQTVRKKPWFLRMGLRRWLARRRIEREARRLLEEAFRSPDALRGTSLARRHAARWVLLRHEAEGGRVARVWFGIVRHPRPYPFSRQSHEVIEHYVYHVAARRMERLAGLNVTRERGEDAAD